MIVSHKHKFIFLKTKKTAGTAVELVLSRVCGPEDIITPTDPSEEVDTAREGHMPRNYLRNGPLNWLPKLHSRLFRSGKLDKTDFYHHMPALLVRKRIGEKIWDSCFKFTIERNPWDRQISYFYYMKSIKREKMADIDFSAFLRLKAGDIKNAGVYLCNETVSVDYFLRYEKLQEDLESLGQKLGKTFSPLQSINVTEAKDKRPYQDFYSRADRQLIEKIYWREIELFGYDFDSGLSKRIPRFGERVKSVDRNSFA
jgi:Sulfotransferase family